MKYTFRSFSGFVLSILIKTGSAITVESVFSIYCSTEFGLNFANF